MNINIFFLILLYLGVGLVVFVRIFRYNAKKSNSLEETLDRIDKTYGCGMFALFLTFWPITILFGIFFLTGMALLNVLFHLTKGEK